MFVRKYHINLTIVFVFCSILMTLNAKSSEVGAKYNFIEPVSQQNHNNIVEIRMKSNKLGSKVWFDPIGLYIKPGTTVRWVVDENVHTTTAYHPENNNHSLRIPHDADPWDSGLLSPGDYYDVTFTVEGTYDYYCSPHELGGMVGRIIVGSPGGPGSGEFDYFKSDKNMEKWLTVPLAAQKQFPDIELIIENKTVSNK